MSKEVYGYVYKFTNKNTNKIYVGQHKYNKMELDESYYGSGSIWKKVISKYGKDSIVREILEFCYSDDDLNNKEIYWIEKLDAMNSDIGYNLCGGGESNKGFKPTEEQKQRMRHPKSNTDKMGKWDRWGENHPMYGKHWSESQKRVNSESQIYSVKLIDLKDNSEFIFKTNDPCLVSMLNVKNSQVAISTISRAIKKNDGIIRKRCSDKYNKFYEAFYVEYI